MPRRFSRRRGDVGRRPRSGLGYADLGPVAQLVEQGTFTPKVAGSIPARPITRKAVIASLFTIPERRLTERSLPRHKLKSSNASSSCFPYRRPTPHPLAFVW